MNQYNSYLEMIIYAFEIRNAQLAVAHMNSLRNLLGGTRSVDDMEPAAAFAYVLALYLARSER